MQVTATQLFQALGSGERKPFYHIVGDEPFQTQEIVTKIKQKLVPDVEDGFRFEHFDGQEARAVDILDSLQTLPGLFDDPVGAVRVVQCSHFDKLSATEASCLEPYFKDPSPTTCFLMLSSKVDRRRVLFKLIEEKGCSIEVKEPYEREWPRWHSFFEKKIERKIEADAWDLLVEASNRLLSILWVEVQKAATFIGDRPTIRANDILELTGPSDGVDIFSFVDDIACRRQFHSLQKFHTLVRTGESEIKMLSLLVRQFRLMDQYCLLKDQNITDSKSVASLLGLHPFLVSKVMGQVKFHTRAKLRDTITLLADCDYKMKRGEGSLFELFLVPYFGVSASVK